MGLRDHWSELSLTQNSCRLDLPSICSSDSYLPGCSRSMSRAKHPKDPISLDPLPHMLALLPTVSRAYQLIIYSHSFSQSYGARIPAIQSGMISNLCRPRRLKMLTSGLNLNFTPSLEPVLRSNLHIDTSTRVYSMPF